MVTFRRGSTLVLTSQYSRRTLSCPSDRLPAIFAMAKRFQTIQPELGSYLAGLWSNHLAKQLLWRFSPGPSRNQRKNPLAPSWSWASVEGHIWLPLWAFWKSEMRLRVLSHSVTPKEGSDEFGALDSWFIVVRGRLRDAHWNVANQTIEPPALDPLGFTATSPDTYEYTVGGLRNGALLPVSCLEVNDATHWNDDKSTLIGPAFSGLLLERQVQKNNEAVVFRRLGLFSLMTLDGRSRSAEVEDATRRNTFWFENAEPQEIMLI